MPERIANLIILAEDREQQNLVRRYLERCGHRYVRPAPLPPGGSGEKYVRDRYPIQVRACRSSLGRKTSAMLIVVVDADTEATERRAAQLARALESADEDPRGKDEPIVILIPSDTSRPGFELSWEITSTKSKATSIQSQPQSRCAKPLKHFTAGLDPIRFRHRHARRPSKNQFPSGKRSRPKRQFP